MLPPEALKENLSLPLPASGGCRHSLAYSHISAPFSHHLLLCVPNLPLPLLGTHLGWHLGPTQIIQDNSSEDPKLNYTCRTFFPNKVANSQILGLGYEYLFFGGNP